LTTICHIRGDSYRKRKEAKTVDPNQMKAGNVRTGQKKENDWSVPWNI
jgi:hypothetical protein